MWGFQRRRGQRAGEGVGSWGQSGRAREKATRPAERRTTERGMTMRAAAMQRASSRADTVLLFSSGVPCGRLFSFSVASGGRVVVRKDEATDPLRGSRSR